MVRATYERRLAVRRGEVERLEVHAGRVANLRLLVFAAAVAVLVAALAGAGISPAWAGAPALIFVALVVVHDRVLRRQERARRAMAFWERGLARLSGTWQGTGVPGDRWANAAHPCAQDLDLFGAGSLFELLCTTRTLPGEETLARWLLWPAPPAVVRGRQEAAQALADRLDLREELAILGVDVRAEVDPARLAAWGREPASLPPWTPVAAGGVALLAVAGAVAWAAGAGPLPFAGAVLVVWAVQRWLRDRVERVVGAVERPARELSVLSRVLERLEREPPASPRMAELRERLTAGETASRRIAELAGALAWMDAARNQLLAIPAWLLLVPVQAACAVERWRARSGPAIAGWLDALGETEALLALATYRHENPDDPFPTLLDGPARFEARGLGHPLIARDRVVVNDVAMGGAVRALVVSGSNMSGKSTLLRTVGVAAVMAHAGLPVRAASLALTPMQPGATLHVQDSLQAGTSRFYAEITRLKQLLDMAGGPVPLLFLLDELLAGTNSHDRRIGAAGVIRGLLDRGAIGLVTTHDLALAEMGGADLANVHFEDQMHDGELHFDYRMRPGVVTRSNALALMQAVGLQVKG
jgi:hypothetical protein